MSLVSRLRLSDESSLNEGTPDEVLEKKRRAVTEALRPKRLEIARSNPKWTEVEDDFVPRGRGWLVSAGTDLVYQPARGVIFASHSTNVIADQTELSFYVDDHGDLQFLERLPGTWTQHLEKRAARELRKAAPRPSRRR